MESIFTLTLPPLSEVICVLDGSTDHSEAVLLPYKERGLQVIQQANQGRAVARNTAISQAKSPYLFFLDDDMRLVPSALHVHIQHHVEHPHSILVGRAIMDATRLKKDFDYYYAKLLEKWENNMSEKTLLSLHNFKFTTSHLSFPAELLERMGRFDPRLKDAEDYDLGMRALQAHIPIYYDPKALAYHDDFPTCAKYIKRQLEYKRSHQKLKELGKQYPVDLFPPIQAPTSPMKLFLVRLFSKQWWVKAIDTEALWFLPKKIRFKLYSVIVYSHTLKGLGLI